MTFQLPILWDTREGFATTPVSAVQHRPGIAFGALELGLWMVMIVALSCGATAPAGIS